MNEGIALTFACRTTSPFHTTRQQYSNLAKCAPFILGSTIRGAVLARLIEREVCPHIDKALASSSVEQIGAAHRACANPQCPIKPFFPDGDPRVWFSFGIFNPPDLARLYRATTRIALERDKASVAEGAILTVESIAPDTPFEFSIALFGDAMRLADDLTWAVQTTAETQGIGRFRSIGYGQFAVEPTQRVSFAKLVEDVKAKWNDAARAEFITPYVIGKGDGKVVVDRTSFTQAMQNDLQATLRSVGVTNIPTLQSASLSLAPEYVSRFSYETGGPQHRLVAWQGSTLELEFAVNDEDTQIALAVVSLLGLGEWRDCGFGCFRKTERTHKRYGAYLPKKKNGVTTS